MLYANVPPPSNPTIPTTNPTIHHSSVATFRRGRIRRFQPWKWRRWQGGHSRQGRGRRGGRCNQCTPFTHFGCNQGVGDVDRGCSGRRIPQALGSFNPQAPTFVPPNAQNIAMPFLNIVKSYANWNVCYTCGFDVEDGHTSVTCHNLWRKPNHQEGFTCTNAEEYLNARWDPCTKGMHKSQLSGY